MLVVVIALALAACTAAPLPAPLLEDSSRSAQPAAVVEPTVAPTFTPTDRPASPTSTPLRPSATPTTRVVRSTPTAVRAAARPAATPTPQWPKSLVITADDIEQGASSVPGLQIGGLDVQFGNNAMTMRFDSLRYSFVSMRNVTVEGRFVVNNCDLDFVADRITPRNLATGAIPGFINQSLDQQLGAWCVESLAVQPGQLVATVRPR
jgi:hypothetical protein